MHQNQNHKKGRLAIVVPCYNEEDVITDTSNVLLNILTSLISSGKILETSRIYFVNDGSKDSTLSHIFALNNKNKYFSGINLSRNFGHQGALMAGLVSIDADMYVSIDADLQDDPNVIEYMVNEYNNGIDIVYGVRKSRKQDTLFKRLSANMFYKTMKMLGVKSVDNHADFRLLSKRAVETLKKFKEKNLFLRATIPLLGYPSSFVYYDRAARLKGESKYPLKKMLAFSWEGVTSFSVAPLRLVTLLGFITCIFSICLLAYVIFRYIEKETISGWASMITVISIFSGVQLLSLGIIGEYIGKIYSESKARPNFIVQDIIDR